MHESKPKAKSKNIISTTVTTSTSTNNNNSTINTNTSTNTNTNTNIIECCMCHNKIPSSRMSFLSCSVKDIDYLSICDNCMNIDNSENDKSRDDFSFDIFTENNYL